jgi:hypothetical protein
VILVADCGMLNESSAQLAEIPDAPPLAIVPAAERTTGGRFSPELARQMAVKAAEARRRKRAERIARAQEPIPEPEQPVEYVAERIARTRAHIERLDSKLLKANDPQEIKWLSDSIAKLQDVERILSGRPAPAPFKQSRRAPNRGTMANLAPVD